MVKQYGNYARIAYSKEEFPEELKSEVVQLVEHSLREGITGNILNSETIVNDYYDEHGIKVDGWCTVGVKMNVEEAA